MADDDWDDAIEDRAQTVSPDVVRKLLEMNPALRARGMDTSVAMDQMNQAQAQKIADSKPKSGAVVGKPASGAVVGKSASGAVGGKSGNDVMGVFKELNLRLTNGHKRIDDEISKLKKAKEDLGGQISVQLMDWLIDNDPDMRSPVTQAMFEQQKPFLQAIGFTVNGYIAYRTRNKR